MTTLSLYCYQVTVSEGMLTNNEGFPDRGDVDLLVSMWTVPRSLFKLVSTVAHSLNTALTELVFLY